jgi:hypothetical protein
MLVQIMKNLDIALLSRVCSVLVQIESFIGYPDNQRSIPFGRTPSESS